MGSGKESASSFAELKASLLKGGKLFEDPVFRAGPAVIGADDSNDKTIQWHRPKEITSDARFFVEGATRFDLHQGDLGNCWFIAASACLATSHKQLFEFCIPPDQDFNKGYAGIFRFNFWQFGTWVEIIVDDLLPCREVTTNGKKGYELVYAHNVKQPNEFWVPLFEKAYAKLNGSYVNLESGLINDALVDFTGGITERIDMTLRRRNPQNLFELLNETMKMASLIGTHIINPTGQVKQMPNGLYTGHAYSVTDIQQLSGSSKLLRIRNPWGRGEWKGPWSDGSKEWQTIPDNIKQKIEFQNLDDGEFWISFEDWLKNFNRMALCHLYPDSLTAEISESLGKRMWDEYSFKSEWVSGVNAGGSGMFGSRIFWTNPQFPLQLKPSNRGADIKRHVIVSLMQNALNNQYSLDIGFTLAKLKDGIPLRPFGDQYNSTEVASTQAERCLPFREVTAHYDLAPGNYVIIPCTQFSNTNGSFLLRIYADV